MELSKLAPAPGSRRKRKRVGLGESSGHGKTSGRGGKGQTARTGGKIRAGFEGGQMPFNRRVPKFGFTSRSKVLGLNTFQVVNLRDLERFPEGATVDLGVLKAARLVKGSRRRAGVKVLGAGTLSKRLVLKVHAISAEARSKVEALGGTVEIVR